MTSKLDDELQATLAKAQVQLAAVTKERDEKVVLLDSVFRENEKLASENARLRGALEPTEENIAVYYLVPECVSGSAWHDIEALLAAIRARAGLDKETP